MCAEKKAFGRNGKGLSLTNVYTANRKLLSGVIRFRSLGEGGG